MIRDNRSRSGRVYTKFLLLLTLFAAAVIVIYLALQSVRKSVQCTDNLREIYQALELYEMDKGALPRLAYFPDDPLTDSDSLRVVLEEYGVDGSACICPAVHPTLRDLGLTYVWNTRLNEANLVGGEGARQWMLVEMTAVSIDVGAPHFRSYNVLYTDGSIEHIRTPLEDLNGL